MNPLVVASVVMLGVASYAVNGASGAEPPPSETGDAADNATATELIKLAARQYDQGRFDDALRTLESARAISPRPGIVYNIGQVQRARKDCAAALTAYQTFLALIPPSDPNHERALRWQAEMQTCVEERAAVERATASKPPVGAAAVLAPERERPGVVQASLLTGSSDRPVEGIRASALTSSPVITRPRPAARIVGWSLLGAGAIAGIAALWLQLKASSIQNDLNGTVHTQAEDAAGRRDGNRYANWALWTGVGGAVLAVSGGAILIVSRRPGPTSTSTSTALLGWRGAF
jgi:tetratricopeptide (TPR) repeat protein